MIFNHIDTPSYDLNRLQEGDVRYYVTPENNKYPSITTVTSFKNRKIFADWRKRVGNEESSIGKPIDRHEGELIHTS